MTNVIEEKGQFPSTPTYHYEGVVLGGNPSAESFDMGFDTPEQAKQKFLNDLEAMLNKYGKWVEMSWRKIPVLVEAKQFDLNVIKYTYTGRVSIKVKDQNEI
jgi:hypothetical protein